MHIVAIFIIGVIHIPITIITPISPIAFFNIIPHPNTLSTTSPKTFPTTGIIVETAVFAVLAVIPSTLLLSVPSNDTTPTNIVNTIPNTHTTLDFRNFDNFSICIFSEIFEIIENTTIIKTIGINIFFIKFAIKFIANNIIGSNNDVVAMLPVYIINVNNSGINTFINPTKSSAVFLTIFIISVKFDIISVTINMY